MCDHKRNVADGFSLWLLADYTRDESEKSFTLIFDMHTLLWVFGSTAYYLRLGLDSDTCSPAPGLNPRLGMVEWTNWRKIEKCMVQIESTRTKQKKRAVQWKNDTSGPKPLMNFIFSLVSSIKIARARMTDIWHCCKDRPYRQRVWRSTRKTERGPIEMGKSMSAAYV